MYVHLSVLFFWLAILFTVIFTVSFQAASPEDSSDGLMFMQEMVELSKAQSSEGGTANYLLLSV